MKTENSTKTGTATDANTVLYAVDITPKEKDPNGEGWSKDIFLISGKKESRGYYDPYGSICGGRYFYYTKHGIKDCAELKKYPTHWRYAD